MLKEVTPHPNTTYLALVCDRCGEHCYIHPFYLPPSNMLHTNLDEFPVAESLILLRDDLFHNTEANDSINRDGCFEYQDVAKGWLLFADYLAICPSCLLPADELWNHFMSYDNNWNYFEFYISKQQDDADDFHPFVKSPILRISANWRFITYYDDNWNYFKKYLPPYIYFLPQVRYSPHPDYNKVIGSRDSIRERGCPLVRDLCHLAAQPEWTDDESLFKDPAFVRAFTGCKKKA